MKNQSKFLVVKTKDSKEITYFDYDKLNGYNLKAKKNVKFSDAINISRMIIINPSFTEKLADHKIKAKFEKFVNLITIVCENEDSDVSGEGYRLALNEAEKLRMEILNKYKKYINEEKLDLYMKKISILEDEIKLRQEEMIYYQLQDQYEVEQEKTGKSR